MACPMRKAKDAGRLASHISRFYSSGSSRKGTPRNGPAYPKPGPASNNPVKDALKGNEDAKKARTPSAPPVAGSTTPGPTPATPAGPALRGLQPTQTASLKPPPTPGTASRPAAAKIPTFTGLPPKPPLVAGPTGPKAAPKDNRWLFSPVLPVDVRLLAVGALALGGFLTYSYLRKVGKWQQESPLDRDPKHDIVEGPLPLEVIAAAEAQESADLAQQGNFYTDELALEARAEHQGSIEEAAQGNDKYADGGDVADMLINPLQPGVPQNDPASEAVAQVLNSVLTNQIELVQAEADGERLLNAPMSEPASPSEAGTPNREAGDKREEEVAEADKKRLAAEKRLQETLGVLKEGVAGTSGEAMLSGAAAQAKMSKRQTEQPQATESAWSTGQLPAASADYADNLGITEDLRPAALIRKAIDRGEGSGENWEEYRQRLAQAEADATSFEAAKQQAAQYHQGEVARFRAESDGKDALVSELESTIRENAATFQQILEQSEETSTKQREAELKRQAEYMATAFAEAALKERASRLGALDEVRMKLNSLSQAFGRRSQEQATSHGVHKLSLGTFALEAALEQGAPFATEAHSLQASCSEDPLIVAAVASLPSTAAKEGVPTHAQLLDRWPSVRQLSSQLSYLPPGKIGILQLGLASLAARLKVKEAPSEGQPKGVDQALAHAEARLVKGQLVDAAATLEKGLAGTAAQDAVANWTADAKARAVAEQAVKLLQAHASSKAACLS